MPEQQGILFTHNGESLAPEQNKSKMPTDQSAIDQILKETEEKIKQEQERLAKESEEKKPDNATGVFCYRCNRFVHRDAAEYVGELSFICKKCYKQSTIY